MMDGRVPAHYDDLHGGFIFSYGLDAPYCTKCRVDDNSFTQLAQEPEKTHEVFDGIESCFWVLYMVIRYLPSKNASRRHLAMFDERDVPQGVVTGSNQKGSYLRGEVLPHVVFSV